MLHGDPETGGPVAIDSHAHLGILDLQVGRHVLQRRYSAQHALQSGRVIVQRVDVGALQRELVEGLGRPAADADRRWQREIGPNSRHAVEFRRELPRDLVRRQAIAERLQADAEPALIHRAAADGGHEVRHVGVAAQDVGDGELMVPHRLEGAALQGFGGPLDLPCVFGGDEALRDQLVEDDGAREDPERHQHRQPTAIHHPTQRTFVPREAALIHTLGRFVPATVPLLLGGTQEPAAQHRREGEGNES